MSPKYSLYQKLQHHPSPQDGYFHSSSRPLNVSSIILKMKIPAISNLYFVRIHTFLQRNKLIHNKHASTVKRVWTGVLLFKIDVQCHFHSSTFYSNSSKQKGRVKWNTCSCTLPPCIQHKYFQRLTAKNWKFSDSVIDHISPSSGKSFLLLLNLHWLGLGLIRWVLTYANRQTSSPEYLCGVPVPHSHPALKDVSY